jgi:hypothetical protein
MTDRIKGCTVVFDKSIRADEVGAVLNAIRMIKGVLDVKPSIDTSDDWMNRTQVRNELGKKIMQVLCPDDEAK